MGDDLGAAVDASKQLLEQIISRPKMQEKLLRRPPFRFLYDIVMNVRSETGFAPGLYSYREGQPWIQNDDGTMVDGFNVKTMGKPDKIDFLERIIVAVKVAANAEFPALTTRSIVAGKGELHTNEFLQAFAAIATNSMIDSAAVVRRIIPQLGGAPELEEATSAPAPAIEPAPVEPAPPPAAEPAPVHRPAAAPASPEPVPRPNELGPGEEMFPEKTTLPDAFAITVTDSQRDLALKQDAAQDDLFAAQVPPTQRAPPTPEKPAHAVEAPPPPVAVPLPAAPVRAQTQRQPSPPSQPEEPPRSRGRQPSRELSAGSGESPLGPSGPHIAQGAVRQSKSALRPPPSRTSSSRQSDMHSADRAVGVIAEGQEALDGIDEEAEEAEADDLDAALGAGGDTGALLDAADPSKHGQLVRDILETQMQFAGKPRTDSAGAEAPVARLSQDEVRKLRAMIQSLSKSTLPLGKAVDYLQEDLESMERELSMWQEQGQKYKVQFREERRKTEEARKPLQDSLDAVEGEIAQQREKIRQANASIAYNQAQITRLLGSIIAR